MITDIRRVTSSQDPAIADYRHRRRIVTKFGERLFLAEGAKIVERLLASRCVVQSVFLDESWFQTIQAALRERPESIDVFLADKPVIEAAAGYSCFQAVKAVAVPPCAQDVASQLKASDQGVPPKLFAATDGLSNAENIGVLIRSLAAFGGDAFLWSATSCTPWITRVIRTSMGTIFQLPIIESKDLAVTLSDLRRQGVRCVAAQPHANQRRLSHCSFAGDCCLVFGNEDRGVSEEVLAQCDEFATIPMSPGVDSLNVAAAAGICFYEAARQRDRA